MADNGKRPETLVEEKQALGIYLESLLRDVPEAGEELPVAEVAAPAPAKPAPVAPAPVVPEPVVEAPVIAPVIEPLAPPPVVTPEPIAPVAPPEPEITVAPAQVVPEPQVQPAPAVESIPEPSPWEGIPEWGEEPFQALLFRLSGLTMAIPLIELDGILEWPTTLTPLPNRSPWYLGLLDNRGKTVPVIELAQLVVPENIRAKKAAGVQNSRIILVGDSRWGVACDSVSEVVTLTPEEVRWRSSRTKRKWLAGTVVNHMCALLDAQGLVHLLSTGQEEPAV